MIFNSFKIIQKPVMTRLASLLIFTFIVSLTSHFYSAYAQSIIPTPNAKATSKLKTSQTSSLPSRQSSTSPLPSQSPSMISRKTFTRVYQEGLQRVIASVRIKPVKRGTRFIGFELIKIASPSVAKSAGLQIGDIILQMNGEPIGRPEQMMRVWNLIQYAPQLTLTFERLGVRQQKQWLIQD